MHIGNQLMTPPASSCSVFSEWMPRGGDCAVFTAELISCFAANATIEVYHKNAEETGPGTSAGTVLATETTPAVYKATVTGLKELVRYRVTIESTDSDDAGGALYRTLAPAWFDTARV